MITRIIIITAGIIAYADPKANGIGNDPMIIPRLPGCLMYLYGPVFITY